MIGRKTKETSEETVVDEPKKKKTSRFGKKDPAEELVTDDTATDSKKESRRKSKEKKKTETESEEIPDGGEESRKEKKSSFGLGLKGKGEETKDAPEDKLELICKSIEKAFKNDQCDTVSVSDYSKIVQFLLSNNRYVTVDKISASLRPEIQTIKARYIAERTGELLEKNDLSTIKKIYSLPGLSDSVVSTGCRLYDYIVSYLDRNTKDMETIPEEMAKLKNAFAGDKFYKAAIEEGCVRKAMAYARDEFDDCENFLSLDRQYNRYKESLDLLVGSSDFQDLYTDRFKAIIDGISDVEDLGPIRKVLETGDRNAFLGPAEQALTERMDALIIGYMGASADVAELNKGFDRAPSDIKEHVKSEYYDNALRILRSERSVQELSEDITSLQWSYIHGSGWAETAINAYCDNVYSQLADENSTKIEGLRYVPHDDDRISDRMAEILIDPVADGTIAFDSLYAWQEYFSKTGESMPVRKVRSKINLQIGKGLMNSDPDIALSFFNQAEFEELGGLAVYAILVKSQNSLKKGDVAMALRNAKEASEEKPGMSSPGKAMIAYITNMGESQSPETFNDAVEAFKAELPSLDDVLRSTALDYIAMAYSAGNLSQPYAITRTLGELDCGKSRFFDAFCKSLDAIGYFVDEDYGHAKELFEQSSDIAEGDERVDRINRLGISGCQWAMNTDMTAGNLKTICDGIFRTSDTRMEKWLSLYIQGLVDEREGSWNYAADKYTRALDHIFDRTELKIRIAEMYIRLNEYEAARKSLEGNEDNITKVMSLELDFLTKAVTRPRSRLEKLTLSTPYERARADLLWGMSEDYNSVWGKAADKYGEGIKEIPSPQRRRDVLLVVELYRRRAYSKFKISRDNLAVANEDYESAIELLMRHDDGTYEMKEIKDNIEREKAEVNSSETVVTTRVAPDATSFQTLNFEGAMVTITGSPIGSGATYSVYLARSRDGRKYAVRMPSKVNPYESKTFALSKDDLVKISLEEEIWEELSKVCPDKIVQMVGTSNEKYHCQLMEYADRSYSDVEGSLSLRERVETIARLLDCLQAIHDAGFVHNDVKPDNLLQVGDVWKLADFDTAFPEGEPSVNPRGTFEYMSPEQFGRGEITEKSDVWAAGVMLCHSLSRRFPFDGREPQYRENVLAGNFNKGSVSPTYLPILERVFSVNPEDRPTAEEFANELRKLN